MSPMIESIVGASAGAVTALALVLGLNSKEVTEVLDFDFSNFISEVDPGKYRMIDENSNLKIGEDKTIYKESELNVFGINKDEEMGGKQDDSRYDLSKDKTKIVGNRAKWLKRELGVSVFMKVLFDGVSSNIAQVSRAISPNKENTWFDKASAWFLGLFKKKDGTNAIASAALARTFQTVILKILAMSWLRSKSPVKVNANVIISAVKDRGMFSGFQVREFFYDLMLFALTKDTYFQQQVVAYYSKEPGNIKDKNGKKIVLSQETFQSKKGKKTSFILGKRSEYEFKDEALIVCERLQHITFRELYAILKVELACAVSNYTTNSPLFFSDRYTPDFRVLEAVAASMSLPPAIRAIFNESDVLFFNQIDGKEPNVNHLDKNNELRSKEVKVKVNDVNDHYKEFVKHDLSTQKVTFTKSDFELYYHVTKKGLQQYLLSRPDKEVYIDLNNVIELNTFLPTLRKILVGERQDKNHGDKGKPLKSGIDIIKPTEYWEDQDVTINGITYTVDIDLLLFFYNAQYKGMLMDGGYFNNIPFNYLRGDFTEKELEGALVIKLDGSYPPEFMFEVNKLLQKTKMNEKQIADQVEKELIVDALGNARFGPTLESLQNRDNLLQQEFDSLVRDIQVKFDEHTSRWLDGQPEPLSKKYLKKNRKHILNVIQKWRKQYGQKNEIKPWATPRALISIAFEGYAYGSKRGQIRHISDHNFIVPLYDFGVDTYDFDLKEVAYLARASHNRAKDDINAYFR